MATVGCGGLPSIYVASLPMKFFLEDQGERKIS
jgi:hypothetical protein